MMIDKVASIVVISEVAKFSMRNPNCGEGSVICSAECLSPQTENADNIFPHKVKAKHHR